MNRQDLRGYFKELLNRSDCSDAQCDQFIALGIRRIERTLRTPVLEKTQPYISDGTGEFPIPNNYIETIGLYYNDLRLERVTDSDAGLRAVTGTPSVYWREGPLFIIRSKPPAGETVKLRYYSEFTDPVIDSDEPAEWAIYSDAIIYSALLYAADFFVDDRKPLFAESFNTIISEIAQASERDEFSGRDLRLSSPFSGVDY
jgi:hypothetical protein